MTTIAFCTSQRFYDLDFFKDILRKTARKYDPVTIRTINFHALDAAELLDFCEALGWRIEKWAGQSGVEKYRDEIRNKSLLRGFTYDHPTFAQPVKFRGEVDICLVFRGQSDKDNAYDLSLAALKMGSSINLQVYREKWKKKRGHDPIFRGIVHYTRDPHFKLKIGPERWVYLPDQERKAA